MNGLGYNAVDEKALRAGMNVEVEEFVTQTDVLHQQGFITKSVDGDSARLSLTPLGLAIIRQIEEDKLQELG
jgi:predicted transcriptional regulator